MVENKKPIVSYRAGSIQSSIFRNKIKGTNGKPDFEVDNIVLQRSYKKADSTEWVNETINIRKNDLIKLQAVLDKLIEHQFLNQKDTEEA